MAEAQARNIAARAAREAASALAASVASVVSAAASALPASGEDAAFELDDATDVGSATTPLGDASPFEYVKSVTDNDVMSITARGVSEEQEADCFAKYELDTDLCSAGGAMFKSLAYFLECKSRAFTNYQQCRGH